MARESQLSSLVIQTQEGVNAAGKPIVKAKNYPVILATATDDEVYAVGLAIASLQMNPPVAIERIDRAVLVPDPPAQPASGTSAGGSGTAASGTVKTN